MSTNKRSMSSMLAIWIAAALCGPARAEPSVYDDFVTDAKPILDTRLRFEGVEQDDITRTAEAMTLRGRLGFESGIVASTALLVEGEFVRPLVREYNSTISGNTVYPVVADPRNSELNRLQITNTSLPLTTVTLGRQRMVLDDQRFVGNVGWRQNEQTFDAIRIVNQGMPHLTLDVSYLNQVNRVFGRDSVQGRYHGDSVLANVSYDRAAGKLMGFVYRIAIDPIAGVPGAVRDSSQTFGVRFVGAHPLSTAKLSYVASYATQQETASNPVSFDLDYYLAEINAAHGPYSFGAGVEILEGDGSKGFTTPLATLHKFQGWADKFLATPADGIDDRYLTAGFSREHWAFLDVLSVIASYHRYAAEHGSMRYGSEIDLQAQAKWQRLTGTLKYANYRADNLFTDTAKLWLQVEYVW